MTSPRHPLTGFTLTARLLLLTGSTCLPLVLTGSALTEPVRSPPNILLAFADDWGRYASAYAALDPRPSANGVVRTPHFDRIAREGALFTHAFVTSPSCTPCRSSLLSGQYFFRTGEGAILQGARWDPAIPSYPLLLRDAGYHLGETYKVWSPGTPVDAPYGAGRHAYEKAGGRFNNFSENVTAMVRDGVPLDDAKERLYAEVRNNFRQLLADRRPGQPFCYWFGPTLVHRKWEKGSGQALWGLDPDLLQGRLPRFLPDVPEVRSDFTDMLGEIQAFDAALGILIAELEAIGELDRTLIVVSGDHGAPGFPGGKCNLYDFGVGVALAARWGRLPPGRIIDDYINLMDLAPTFLDAAGVPVPEIMTGRTFLPQLLSRAAGQIDPERTWVITGRERHVAAARPDYSPYPHRALRTPDFLYIVNFKPERWPMGDPFAVTPSTAPSAEALANNTFVAFPDMDASPTKAWLVAQRNEPAWGWYYHYAFAPRPAEELYALAEDPDQIVNVADDPRFLGIKARLREQLFSELKRAADPRVTGDGQTFERAPYAGPLPP